MLQEYCWWNWKSGSVDEYKSKKKVVMENDTPVYVNNTQIENIETYIDAGQTYSTINKNQDK